jgi:peptidoglycan-associated lipoprotein
MWCARHASRPVSRRLQIGAAAVLALGFVVGATAASAEESAEREILIGTMRLGGPSAFPGASERGSDPMEAEALLEAAVGEFDSGRLARAQRQFEALVARHHDTAAAAHARRHLAALYERLERPRQTAAPAPTKSAAGAGASAPSVTAQARDGWSTEVHRGAARTEASARLAHRLRLEVGDRVFFAPGSAELGARAHMVLAGQAEWLKRQPELVAVIEGHADDPGPAEENLRLASLRAEAVRQRLIGEGISPARVTVHAAGNTNRVAVCGEPACAAQNRRALTLVQAPGAPARGLPLGQLPAAGALAGAAPIAGEPARGSRAPR